MPPQTPAVRTLRIALLLNVLVLLLVAGVLGLLTVRAQGTPAVSRAA